MNGTYLCPPDYADCAGRVNSYEYAVYESNLRTWLNLPSLATVQTGLVTFTGRTPTFYRRSNEYARNRLSLAPITAGLSMYPLLLQEGRVVNSENEQSDAQKLRSMKGSIGVDDSHVYLVLVANASVTESAHVLQALRVRDALNLDGGGTVGDAARLLQGRAGPSASERPAADAVARSLAWTAATTVGFVAAAPSSRQVSTL